MERHIDDGLVTLVYSSIYVYFLTLIWGLIYLILTLISEVNVLLPPFHE